MSEGTTANSLLDWLTSVGVGECAEALTDADIDMDVVRDLTDHDLRELGLSLGQRKRLIRGINALNQNERRAADPEAARAEQRQLSVLFCDLVGSTGLSTRVDAEEFAGILQDYHRLCSSIATQWGGRMIAQFGDGCMIIFGHPRMHENDAERAIRAGQQMIHEIAQSGPFAGEYLTSRVAVATGRVVIGDLTGASSPDALAGETPNLAARLQGTVEPQELIIDERTMRLVSHAFDLTPVGAQHLRGFDKPIEGWLVGEPRETRSRYDMLAPTAFHDIFGRDAELALLTDRWRQAMAGEGQVVVLRGEGGIGKSWLISSFASQVLTETADLRRLRFFCSEIQANSALHPVMDQFAWAAGVRTSDDPQRVQARVDRYFENLPEAPDDAADLVGARLTGAATPGGLNAAQQKQATFRMLHNWLEVEAERGPILIEFEDAHWSDPSSMELLTQLANAAAETAPSLRMMIIVTHRPEFQTGWPPHPWITERTLDRLTPAQCTELAKTIAGTSLAEARLREVVAKADGVPLFVREITRAVTDASGGQVGDALDVPDTLEGSLIARLDRLGSAKGVVQVASLLGRLFHEEILARVSNMNAEDLQTALAELVDAEIITPLPDVGAGAYLFRHALIQDAAYGSLLRRERRDLHHRAAEVLAGREPSAQAGPEVLARHYAGAEMPMQAVEKLIEAGRAATARAAQIEANNHFRTALELLADVEQSPESQRVEALVHGLLGQSLIATMGFGAPEIADSFARARELSEQTGDHGLLLASAYGQWAVAAARGERARSQELAGEAMTLFAQAEVPIFQLAAYFMDGVTRLYDKQLDAAEASLGRAVELYDPEMYPLMMQAFGDDIGTFAIIYLQWIRSLRGDFLGAAGLTARLQEIAGQLDDRQIEARNLGFATSGAQTVGAAEMTLDLADQLMAVASERCYPHWIAVAQINRGWAVCCEAGDADGIAEIEAGLAFYNAIGQRTPLSLCHGVLAEAHLALGDVDEALATAQLGLAACESSLDRLYAPELKRLAAECLAARDTFAGRTALRSVISESEEAGLYYFALKAAISLARTSMEGTAHQEALTILADVRARITQPIPLPLTIIADQLLSKGGL